IEKNMSTYFEQAGAILDMAKVEKRHNSEWLHKLTYLEIGEHANQFSVADFTARDNIKRRLDAGKRVSLREILYPLMQGYDSVAIEADVELGGVDQRFNLLAGRTLQEHFGQEAQNIVMTPLIDGTDGRKMSSSWGNTVNLTESASEMYAKIMRTNDEVMPMYFTNLTRIPIQEVHEIIEGLKSGALNPLDTKKRLAYEIVSLFHNAVVAETAQKDFVSSVQKGDTPEEVKRTTAKIGEKLHEVLEREDVTSSKTEFRRLIEAGAITNKTNDEKITDIDAAARPGVYKIGKHRFLEIQS
ncbi:MAG: tyrosine--tRNA ligase, partial [Candidatus Pacebacteria bacterium]|nr:tyrosine--tRNA ligase [Candidatus Paceibacterota bacterium]